MVLQANGHQKTEASYTLRDRETRANRKTLPMDAKNGTPVSYKVLSTGIAGMCKTIAVSG